MKKINLKKILTKGKAFYLAYDQGMEHGPVDFNDKNVNPEYIIKIAKEGKFNGMIFQKGIAEKYNKEIKKSKVPLIIKINGKTNLKMGDPLSTQLCSVQEAMELGAVAIGYTIYIGSEHEAKMMKEFESIEREAHANGLPILAWIYPRGKGVKGKKESELLAYACRVGLEIGADMVKVHWNGKNTQDLKWAVKSAGKCKVIVAGGIKTEQKKVISQTKKIMQSDAAGIAIGRNIWQHKNPLLIAGRIRKVIFSTQTSKRKN